MYWYFFAAYRKLNATTRMERSAVSFILAFSDPLRENLVSDAVINVCALCEISYFVGHT